MIQAPARPSRPLRPQRSVLTAAWLGATVLAGALAGCGQPSVGSSDARPSGTGQVAPTSPTGAGPQASVAAPGAANHTVYAARGLACEQCHPCGQRIAGGHAVAWMDTTSPGFHAFSADAGLAGCGTCHGANLDGVGGTTTVACAQCHGATWRTSCTFCHGGTDNQTGAPPRPTWGHSGDAVRVGAHTAHLAATHGLAAPVACTACHVVPSDALAAGHVASGIATVTFSGLASAGVPSAPTWTRTTATCATVYCHGGKYAGDAVYAGSAASPRWTDTTAVAGSCGSCHKAPPSSAAHASVTATTNCGTCHTGYSCTTANLAACTVNTAVHINGVTNVSTMACNTCHGSASNNAPPAATTTASSAVKVGAHQAHVVNTRLRSAALGCADCHTVPTSTSHASGVVDMTWGALARTGTITPMPANLGPATTPTQATWEATPTCTNYCHGGKYAGNAVYAGSALTPRWTDTTAVAGACGSCHKAPPSSAGHASVTATTSCGSCHTGYSCTTANLAACTVNTATHLNGTVDVANLTCTTCHGTSGQTATAAAPLYAAPPVDAAGLATGGFRIGAHQKHLTSTTYAAAPLACATCHWSVGTYTTAHPNGTRDVAFTGAPSANLRKGTWTASTGTAAGSCASTWCHGAVTSPSGGASGGTLTSPTWTGAVTACTACHAVAMSSLTNNHTRSNHRGLACTTCHGTGYTSTASGGIATGTAVNKATHLDGTRTIVTVATGTGIRTYNATSRSCAPSCHGTETW